MDLIDGSSLNDAEVCMIICGCWSIWNERNSRRHGEGGRSVTSSIRWVMQTCLDLAQAGRDKNKKMSKIKVRWKPPDQGAIKINTDAGFDQNTMSGSTGLVVRDSRGDLLRAQAIWYNHAANARIMEAIAIRDGAKFALERGYTRVIIESDVEEVVICNDDGQNRSEIMSICQEIRDIIGAFSSCSISCIGRAANVAAHLCAKQASADRRRCLWINYIPNFLADALQSDCNPVV